MDRIPRFTRHKTVEIILPDRLFIDISRGRALLSEEEAEHEIHRCVVFYATVCHHGNLLFARDRHNARCSFCIFLLPFCVSGRKQSVRVTSCYGVPLIALKRDASEIRPAPASSAFPRRGFYSPAWETRLLHFLEVLTASFDARHRTFRSPQIITGRFRADKF